MIISWKYTFSSLSISNIWNHILYAAIKIHRKKYENRAKNVYLSKTMGANKHASVNIMVFLLCRCTDWKYHSDLANSTFYPRVEVSRDDFCTRPLLHIILVLPTCCLIERLIKNSYLHISFVIQQWFDNQQYMKVKIYRIPYWIQISFLGYMRVFKGYDYRVQQYEFNRLVDCALNNWMPIQQSSVSQCVLGFENSAVSERTSHREQRKSTFFATCGKRTCLELYLRQSVC